MTEKKNEDIIDLSESYCYTYEVTMVVQILAPNKDIADAKLNQDGGYVSSRNFKLLNSVFVYKDEKEEEEEEEK
jgi:hypothetical protein